MNYAAYVIRETRLKNEWSQESICKDICSPSYLSKIEQGKVDASQEIVALLLQRLHICWNEVEDGASLVEEAYDLLFSYELQQLATLFMNESFQLLKDSIWGVDYLLIQAILYKHEALHASFECLFDTRQLALQHLLQKQYQDAINLYPCAYMYLQVGFAYYYEGNYTKAIEYIYQANTLACNEGRAQIMLQARMTMGSCYSNMMDFEAMKQHYMIVKRLARTLHDQELFDTMQYNYAATCMEAGLYEEAFVYFKTQKDSNKILVLHKLAICYEQLHCKEEALEILKRAQCLKDSSICQIETKMCELVMMRLYNNKYLEDINYGKRLFEVFELCKKYAPKGFASFHVPWMIEWYEYHRQYKQIVKILQDFPRYHKN